MIKQDNRIDNNSQTSNVELLKKLLETPSDNDERNIDKDQILTQPTQSNSSVVINITGDNNQVAAHGTASKPVSSTNCKSLLIFTAILLLFF